MVFAACAIIAKRHGADLAQYKGSGYEALRDGIRATLEEGDEGAETLLGEYSRIEANPTGAGAIDSPIDHITDIADYIGSDMWDGEDITGTFFNILSRKKKSNLGQVFTPEHVADLVYRILEVGKNDRVLDAACGSGVFLMKAAANMIREAGGTQANEAADIMSHLYGIEFDRDVHTLAYVNMLMHDGPTGNIALMDSRTEDAGKWIRSKSITKVLMNPPYENKYGCMKIVENVLDNVPPNTLCGFILPDKKLERASKTQMARILKHHRLLKVIKLPEDLFFGVSVTTSIFVFKTGVPQNGEEFFACWMKDDGLVTVRNKGRHDVYGRWPAIEDRWVGIVRKQTGDDTCQWVDPAEHLSYQKPQPPFEITEEDFRRTVMDYLLFKKVIDAKELAARLTDVVMYSSRVDSDDETVTITVRKEGGHNDED